MFTSVNSPVNNAVNSCSQHNSPKTVNSVNRQKALGNIGKMLVKEMLSVQLCSNAEKVIDGMYILMKNQFAPHFSVVSQ